MTKTFFNISQQECLRYYGELLENSERHFKAAEQLAATGEYGIAVSLKILGSEELVKAMIIYLDGSGLRIRQVDGVKKLFKDHKIRHFFASLFVMMVTVIRPMFEMLTRFRELLHNPEARVTMNQLERALFDDDIEKATQIAADWEESNGRSLAERVGEQVDFWSDADEYKMKGFYVDYTQTLVSPKHLTEEDYRIAKEATNFFKLECMRIINYLNQLQEGEKGKFVKALNKDNRLYDLIKQMIEGFKANPF